jgi:hypothetical protein
MKIRQYRDQFIKTYRQFMEGEAGFSTILEQKQQLKKN